MTIVLILAAAFAGAIAGAAAQRHADAHRLADAEQRAELTDYFRAAADRLAVELDDVKDEAGQAIVTLRAIVADQAVIVRRALGRPQKRLVPGRPS